MSDLVFDVSYERPLSDVLKTYCTARGLTGAQAAELRDKYPNATITPRKLLPCAQRPATARIATPSPAGTIPGYRPGR